VARRQRERERDRLLRAGCGPLLSVEVPFGRMRSCCWLLPFVSQQLPPAVALKLAGLVTDLFLHNLFKLLTNFSLKINKNIV
jgi:hypothetical protein